MKSAEEEVSNILNYDGGRYVEGEDVIAEFLFGGRRLFYKIEVNPYGEIEHYTKLNSKPINLDHQYSLFHSDRLYNKLAKDFMNMGMILNNMYKKNHDNEGRSRREKFTNVFVVNR